MSKQFADERTQLIMTADINNKVSVKQEEISCKYKLLQKCTKISYFIFIRVVATTPEKTHNQKFLTFETILNRFLVQFYPGFKKKKKKKKKKKLPPLYIDQLKCGIRPPTPPTPPPPDAFWGTTL